MIWFQGTRLTDAAPVKIVDVLVSPIEMNATARQRPVKWGADFVRMTGGARTVSVDFALLERDVETRQRMLRDITRWARQTDVGRLEIEGHEGLYLNAVCTRLPEPSIRQWWESKLRVVFTCFDPYWYDVEEHFIVGENGEISCVIDGSAPPGLRLEWDSAQAGDWAFSDGNDSMRFDGVPAGHIVIDLNRQTAEADGVSIMSTFRLSEDNTFLTPAGGALTWSYVTDTGGAPGLYWRERWE